MADTYRPETVDQVAELVAWAAAEEAPLEVLTRGSKRGLGRPIQAQAGLDLSAFTSITLYEPEELVLGCRAGTPLAEIEAALAAKVQAFAFEPADLGPLLGGEAGQASIGGVVACNLSGPRRVKAGAARDHFLGVHAVSGRGEVFKSGGRVVKNVSGYDLCKLLAGSYGTLGAMTDLTLKVLPAAEETRTVLLAGLDDATAQRAMARALQSAYEVSGAAHLPAAAAKASEVSTVARAGGAVTALRIEGPPVSVKHRSKKLAEALADFGETGEMQNDTSLRFWREVRDAHTFVGDERAVWRLSVPPTEGPRVAAAATRGLDGAACFYDWGGGLIWLALPEDDDAHAEAVRAAIGPGGGHATLIRATEKTRAKVPVFQPQDPGMARLTARLKDGFDPKRVLNPGRMHAGV